MIVLGIFLLLCLVIIAVLMILYVAMKISNGMEWEDIENWEE